MNQYDSHHKPISFIRKIPRISLNNDTSQVSFRWDQGNMALSVSRAFNKLSRTLSVNRRK
ncbi:conserved hypothetical protein [delta proteobacterium NaphS2]|nr:conserved hypothetical protein [delta proteobacterium NaphS2]